ncbi:MAG: YbbR-like domain-containing protein [bacterium]
MFRKIKNLILNNWPAKVLCLLIAIALWSWVKIQQSDVRTFKVNYSGVPKNLVVVDKNNTVSVELSGPKTKLNSITQGDLNVEIDLSKYEAGEHFVRILPWDLNYPRGLKVDNIDPGMVRVVLEERIRKTVQVQSQFNGQIPDGYNFQSTLDPDTAVLQGSRKILSGISKVALPSIDLSDQTSNFTRVLEADIPEGVKLTYPESNKFTVEVTIQEEYVTKLVSDIPVKVLGVPQGMKPVIEPSSTIQLKLRAAKRVMDDLQPSDILAEVRAPDTGTGPVIRSAHITLPNSVEKVGSQGDRRTVKVLLKQREPEKTEVSP